MWYSPTAILTYEECPKKYDLRYRQKVKVEEGEAHPALRYGLVMHAALEAAYRHAADVSTETRRPFVMADAWDEARQRFLLEWDAQDLANSGMSADVGLERLGDALGALPDVEPGSVLGIEQRLKVVSPDGTDFIGVSDLILRLGRSTILVDDHKVGKEKLDAAGMAVDFATNLYAWAATVLFPWAQTVYVGHHYPDRKKRIQVESTQEARDDAVARFEAVAEMTTVDTDFTPDPGLHCDRCPFQRAHCPAWEDGRLVMRRTAAA